MRLSDANSVAILWRLLNGPTKKQIFYLILLTTLSGFVEVISVGLIIPFVAIASGSLPFGRANYITNDLVELLQSFGVPEKYITAALGMVFLLGVVGANVYLCAYQFYAAKVIHSLRNSLSVRVAKSLTLRPLEWLDSENSSDLVKVALTDVQFVSTLTNAVIQVAAIATRCCVVYLFFLITQARLAIALVVSLAVAYQLVFRYVQRPIVDAGAAAHDAQRRMHRTASELIEGARPVRATATERQFLQRFISASESAVQPHVLQTMPNYVTRAGLETSTVALVIALLIYFNNKDGNLANGLPLLSSYAVAGIRLLPAVQQALNYYLEVKFYAPSLVEVSRLLETSGGLEDFASTSSDLSKTDLTDKLEIRDLSYSYPTGGAVLKNISLTILKNTRVAFVGETGAGKSTLADILLSLREPGSGQLLVDGKVIEASSSRGWRRSIGYVPQSIYLLDASIMENVAFGMELSEISLERVKRACETASLTSFIENLPKGLDTFVGERGVRLSGGQCQRIGIARALYHDPDIVIFDEATSSLDTVTETAVLEALGRLKGVKTLLVVAHRLNTIWDFDNIFVLERGEIVSSGNAQQLLNTSPTFARLAQDQMSIGQNPT